MTKGISRNQIAWRVAQEISDGDYVNLGVGMPDLVVNYLPKGQDIIFHCENGILGMGPEPAPEDVDFDLINASKTPITLIPGGAYFHHADSFSMIRGGHIDICALGAFQVSATGDLANWSTGITGQPVGVGGAMDLAVGAKKLFIMMTHTARDGGSKIVPECTMPLTARACVTTVFTDLAVIDVTPDGLVAREIVDGLSFEELEGLTSAALRQSPDCRPLAPPELE